MIYGFLLYKLREDLKKGEWKWRKKSY
jgi:hypothetical protein